MSTVAHLARQWAAAGVERGDALLLHSNIRRMLLACRRGGRAVSPDEVLDSFLEALGPEGTLLLPLFNFDFTKGVPFDIRHTPSQMGVLTEAGRRRAGAVRTGHPTYSFAAIGAQSERFRGVDNFSAFGEDSPFAILRELDGKIAALDLDEQNSMTFYHHVEELKRVPYRYFKDFTGTYIGWDGVATTRTYRLYVRDLERGVVGEGNPAAEMMWERGLYRGDQPGVGSGLRTIKASDMFEFLSSLIDTGRALGTMYSTQRPRA
jgi:aminoglycoside 3-N-acetyltransferase